MFTVEQLLSPIEGANPCGEDLSFSKDLDAIAQARRFDDATLDQGAWETELKEADWGFVVEHCARLLESRSKDLRLAVWLAEANAKVNYFAGLGDGYLVLAELCDRYWDNLYPLPDDRDQEQRIGNLNWLLVRSATLVREIPITEGKGTAFSTLDFEGARLRAAHTEKLLAETGKTENETKLVEMEAARRKSSRAFFEKLVVDVRHCMAALVRLEAVVDARLGREGPAFSGVRDALEGVMRTVSRFAQEAGVRTSTSAKDTPEGANTISPAVLAVIPGAIQTREQALAQLRLVADFFRRTEPHSPVAYLADKAAVWGEMPLHTWLGTVIKDPASLAHVEELLGLKAPPPSAP